MKPHSSPLQEKEAASKMQSMQICSMKAKWGLPKLAATKQNKVFCFMFFLSLRAQDYYDFLAAINQKLTTQSVLRHRSTG